MTQSNETTIEYVCGFYFDHTFQQVVLIWKNKPAWQKGKLNGVGGKIEKGESPITAMRREFYEETGVRHNEWVDLIVLTGEDWRVYFFCAIGNVNEFEYVESQEEEEVAKIEVDRLLAYDYPHIPNLDWLIPMGIYKLAYPIEAMSFYNQQKQNNEAGFDYKSREWEKEQMQPASEEAIKRMKERWVSEGKKECPDCGLWFKSEGRCPECNPMG